ncbi:MAG: 23S rRNA (uracil(1939)-C(5))-methyltransferase RlmD [Clostridiales bacterium]|nr:23S rRNA (uracil(1939)-C(5))-methyltransferase RlmD [Clostridiales bacterium]
MTPLARNEYITLTIDALNSEGQGVGRKSGYTVFVPGALPGETVRALMIKPHKKYAVAKLSSILGPESPARVKPPCPVFGRCGGCALQHMHYDAQLFHKRQMVKNAMQRIGGIFLPDVLPVLGMQQPWRYRNKGSFPMAMQGGALTAGLFAIRSHRLIAITDCLIQRPKIIKAMQGVQAWARQYRMEAYDEELHTGILRHIVARITGKNELMLILVATRRPGHTESLVRELLSRDIGLKSVYLNINVDTTNAILSDDFALLWGNASITEELGGLSFGVGPSSFLQVNHAQTELLYAAAMESLRLGEDKTAIDAYCGIGTITLRLAPYVKHITGIEYMPQAVDDAKKNAHMNAITNARFYNGAAETMLGELLRQGGRPDILVMDPPRKGVDPAFIQTVQQSGIEQLLYISCDPATLGRDCKLLLQGGYVIGSIRPVDMFPQSSHVETIVLLQRGDS